MCLQVTVAFCAPEGMLGLQAACSRAAKQALEMFCSAVSRNAAQLA
jgi:hypothetical protein